MCTHLRPSCLRMPFLWVTLWKTIFTPWRQECGASVLLHIFIDSLRVIKLFFIDYLPPSLSSTPFCIIMHQWMAPLHSFKMYFLNCSLCPSHYFFPFLSASFFLFLLELNSSITIELSILLYSSRPNKSTGLRASRHPCVHAPSSCSNATSRDPKRGMIG